MVFSFPRIGPHPAPHLRVGKAGEAAAHAYLRALGYELRGANVRVGRGEIDLLAYDPQDGVLVFVEVKARSRAHEAYRPELNLTPRKRSRMAKAARQWIAETDYQGGYRLDLLCVAGGRIVDHLRELAWGDEQVW